MRTITSVAPKNPSRRAPTLTGELRVAQELAACKFKDVRLAVTQLYRSRWQIELFFKWIKQHLRIKAFYGTSPNAVRTQIWSAIAVYLLVALLKKRLHLEASLYTILQILSLTLFEKMPISQALAQLTPTSPSPNLQNHQCLMDF